MDGFCFSGAVAICLSQVGSVDLVASVCLMFGVLGGVGII